MITSAFGWLGSILYLINHGYISAVKRWRPSVYYGGNFIAAVALVISSLMIVSYQAVLVNLFWAVISALLLAKVDVAKVPLSKRLFLLGFTILLVWVGYIGLRSGWLSSSFHHWLGWSSTYVFCLSYFLFCSKKLGHLHYLLFNIYAATALLPILWQQQNWPVFTLEVCWAAISFYGVARKIEQVHLID